MIRKKITIVILILLVFSVISGLILEYYYSVEPEIMFSLGGLLAITALIQNQRIK